MLITLLSDWAGCFLWQFGKKKSLGLYFWAKAESPMLLNDKSNYVFDSFIYLNVYRCDPLFLTELVIYKVSWSYQYSIRMQEYWIKNHRKY